MSSMWIAAGVQIYYQGLYEMYVGAPGIQQVSAKVPECPTKHTAFPATNKSCPKSNSAPVKRHHWGPLHREIGRARNE